VARTTSEYERRRDFRRTPEPRGGRRRASRRPRFVVHEHRARSPHYDLRLEIDGALASWAVPKGPSTDPRVRRLAVPTEDHPLEYADFEGVIPAGEYGAGAVIVWDRGRYRNLREDCSLARARREGKLSFWLEGEKLRGAWALVRTGRARGERERWLLVKQRDEHADARRRPTSTEPRSVLSGRTSAELQAEAEG
jgi:DNA ligase D-like protein (predicted 3'-phosphoesterase)